MKTITYKHLVHYFQAQHPEIGKQNFKVYQSNLKKFLEFHGKTLDAPVESELYEQQKLGLFFEALLVTSGEKTVPGFKTKIKRFQEAYLMLSLEQGVTDNSFGAALGFLIERSGWSVPEVSKLVGVSFNTLYRWIKAEAAPCADHLIAVEKLERVFGLPIATLRKKLGLIVFGAKTTASKTTCQTEYGKTISALQKLPYKLGFKKWPDALQADMERMNTFYTADYLTGDLLGMRKSHKQNWKTHSHGECHAYENEIAAFEKFFGFLVLPPNPANPKLSGLGFDASQLSLTLALNETLIDAYIRFRAVRHGGKITSGTYDFLKTIIALLRERFGYLRQCPELGKGYLILDEAGKWAPLYQGENDLLWKEKWNKLCDEKLDTLIGIRDSIRVQPFRDTKEPIQPLINSGDIFGAIKSILHTMRTDAEAKGWRPGESAVRYRDFVSALFHFTTELRCNHFSFLELDRHLIKNSAGHWQLKIFKNELKVPETLIDDEVVIDLPHDISRYLDEYVTKYRPQLHGANECKYLFLAAKNSNTHTKENFWLRPESISRTFSERMKQYSECPSGFGSHAVRKVISTATQNFLIGAQFNEQAILALHSAAVSQKHYTCGQIQAAFKRHFKRLQESGVLELPPEQAERKVTLEEENQFLKSEVDGLRQALADLQTRVMPPALKKVG